MSTRQKTIFHIGYRILRPLPCFPTTNIELFSPLPSPYDRSLPGEYANFSTE
jgi:hypothetical protein